MKEQKEQNFTSKKEIEVNSHLTLLGRLGDSNIHFLERLSKAMLKLFGIEDSDSLKEEQNLKPNQKP